MSGPSAEGMILARCRTWLGDDLYAEANSGTYVRLFWQVVRAARGEVPETVSPYTRLRYLPTLWELFESVVDGAVRRWVKQHRPSGTPQWVAWNAPEGQGPGPARMGELKPSVTRPRVSLNEASIGELAAVPGLGERTAARIVARRVAHGPFRSLEQLEDIRGLSKKAREQAIPYLTVSGPRPPAALSAPELLEDGEDPLGFPAYVRLLVQTGLRRAGPEALPANSSPAALALGELERLADEVRARPYWEALRRLDLPDVERATTARARAGALNQRATELRGVAPIRNARYLDFAEALIDRAQERVYVQMFFFTSSGQGPGARLAQALSRARQRGVDVRVLLDMDLPEDYHGASRVNKETVDLLRELGVSYRTDALGVTTHSKLLLVDRDQALIGSHNWTTPAMFLRDETSVYLEGVALVSGEATRFEQLWRSCDPDPAARTIAFDLLLYPIPFERIRLSGAGFQDSHAFLAAHGSPGSVHARAADLGIDPERLLRLWRLLRLMHEFGVPEPTAYALTLTAFDAPSEVRRTPVDRVIAALKALPPLDGVYSGRIIRLDIVAAALGGAV